MRLALYCPVYGYYEAETDKIGRRGDFYTSVSTGSLFGELLGLQFSGWLEALSGVPTALPLQIIEAGAYHGQLARDILCWFRTARPGLWDRLQYTIIEPAARQEQRQRETLAGFADHVRWTPRILPGEAVFGIIFSNELLDAFPVRRIGWDANARRWFEWGVRLEKEKFVWHKIRDPGVPITEPRVPEELIDLLPDEFTTEICPSALQWWRDAATSLDRGKLLAIDYGLRQEEFLSPERRHGTLRGYSKHRITGDLLAHPGQQDLTAHVNFSAVQHAGEAEGLITEEFVSQEKFLMNIVGAMAKVAGQVGNWTASQRRQLQTLTHPHHLGRSFRVLVQSRADRRS